MADNRHFTDALQNEGSSPVYLEDKKLAERTPVSGAASIANLKFLLANDDTEGFNTAIKAYIDEAVRSALGALVNNLDKGTAISRILATDGNSDLGTISPANLASVLGVSGTYLSSGTLADLGYGFFCTNDASHVSGLPSDFNNYATAFVRLNYQGYTATICVCLEVNKGIYARRFENGTFIKVAG